MASTITSREVGDKPLPGDGARILLVSRDSRELVYYGAVLQKAGCSVRASSSFAKGAQCLEREPYDLIVLDQGSSRFEGREVLMSAMEVNPEVSVLVLAHSYDRGCYEEAMQGGALDYVEGPMSEVEIVAFLETYVPRRSGSPRSTANRSDGPIRGEKNERKARFQPLQVASCVPVTSGENMAL